VVSTREETSGGAGSAFVIRRRRFTDEWRNPRVIYITLPDSLNSFALSIVTVMCTESLRNFPSFERRNSASRLNALWQPRRAFSSGMRRRVLEKLWINFPQNHWNVYTIEKRLSVNTICLFFFSGFVFNNLTITRYLFKSAYIPHWFYLAFCNYSLLSAG
jgi:hypothetical protein